MEGNPTVGYSLGMIEGYLESLEDPNALTILEYLKVVEMNHIQQSQKLFECETKLQEIQLNLSGWKKI